tara:strand:- start:8564 stop:11590 length:3027 start_codon:yes stop_codon:yes gene_type:complete
MNRIYFIVKILFLTFLMGQSSSLNPELIELLNDSGVSERDAKRLLNQSGISIQDLNSLSNLPKTNENDGSLVKELNQEQIKNDLDNVYSNEQSNSENFVIDKTKDSKIETLVDSIIVDEVEASIEKKENSSAYFGYNIFYSNPEVFQKAISESVDPKYQIGIGDDIVIVLWGETELNKSFTVQRDGYIFVPNIGQIFVNGLTISKLEKKLFRILKKAYSSLSPVNGNATTFLDVSLGSLVLRPLRVFVVGEVNQPGAYDLKSSASLFTSLYYFNGPKIQGSLRNIKLIRDGKEHGAIDFYDYLLTGKQVNDIRLQRDDVIFIPPRGKTVRVEGEIKRPYYYELKDSENLNDLINISGGLMATTYTKRIQIDRIVPFEKRASMQMDRTKIDLNLERILDESETFGLHDGDIITFFKIFNERKNIVTIEGSVKRPGVYDLGNGMTLKKLIEKADGLDGNAFLEKADITRINRDFTESYIDVNLGQIFENDEDNSLQLQSKDIIKIYNQTEMKYNGSVSILGHVKAPGDKPFRKGMELQDLIFIGGGFEDKNHLKYTYMDRADLVRWKGDSLSKEIVSFRLDSILAGGGIGTLKLKMDDLVRIYSLSDVRGSTEKSVYIRGHVLRPGEYSFIENNMMLYDLVFMAGGFESEKHKSSTLLSRADIIRTDIVNNKKWVIQFNIGDLLENPDGKSNIKLIENDIVLIYKQDIIESISDSVRIEGLVFAPGNYEFKKAMSLSDLILESGGTTTGNNLFRAEIARQTNKVKTKYAEIITLDLNTFDHVTDEEAKANGNGIFTLLKPNDIIKIRPSHIFSKQKQVQIEGSVYYPGKYVISKPHEKVTDIITRAGGLKKEAYPRASILIRNNEIIKLSFHEIIKNPRSRLNFVVSDGDLIRINEKPNLVKVEGNVNNPGNFQYIKGKRLNDYIKLAGGLNTDAAKRSIYIVYPDGTSGKHSYFKISPKVLDGSVIKVGKKEDVEPFNITEYVTSLTGIYADLIQAYLMIRVLSQDASS